MRLCLHIAAVPVLAAWVAVLSGAEPISLSRAEATFHAGGPDELAHAIDGVEAGPHGWSVTPRISESQALVVRCAQPVGAAELDITLFFLSGRPNNSIAEFALDYTTDAEPSLKGNWKPLEIQRFTAEVATLQRTTNGHLRAALLPDEITGIIPDDTYRVAVILPGGLATGFRLRVFPVFPRPDGPAWMSWGSPHDFVLTEFRVQVHSRESTNIALHRPVKASHRLNGPMLPGALTDGLPATIAHPMEPGLGTNFHFDIDLGRIAALDHIGLRTRGDGYLDRFSRMIVQLYEKDPESGGAPVWEGMDRADGSHPEAGTADIIRAGLGRGVFRGRYLRLSTDNKVPSSPQLAEVEVYEVRTPEVVEARADGRDMPVGDALDLPPGVRRLSLRLRIPQVGLPAGIAFRWRTRGDLEEWQPSRLMTIDMPCPPPGKTIFEAQALHSDNQWDATNLHGHAEEYLGLAGIRCHFASTEAMPAVSLSSTFRHHLLMMAKEALHNVVSHAAATVVTICIGVQGSQLRIEIGDNGRGLPSPATLKAGNGIENMKSRAASLGGTCEFVSPASGSGTVVRLTIPLPSPPEA